jgi:hypothetical protein
LDDGSEVSRAVPGAIVHQRRAVRLEIGERIGWFSVHRAFEASDVGSHVLDAASIAVSRRSRRVKTDWIDVETLPHSERLRAREAANLFNGAATEASTLL